MILLSVPIGMALQRVLRRVKEAGSNYTFAKMFASVTQSRAQQRDRQVDLKCTCKAINATTVAVLHQSTL